MRMNRIAAGLLAVVAMTCAVSGAVAEGPMEFDADREIPVLVAERSGVVGRLADARSGAVGLKATLGSGFDRQPMGPAEYPAPEPVPVISRPTTSAAEEIAEVEVAAPLAFSFGQAVPTPFEHSTQLSFDLPATSRVRIESYDVRGREVKGAVSEELGPGRYQRMWVAVDGNGRSLPPGIYLLRIEASSVDGDRRFSAVRKLLLMR